jgi:hypothetical protein
MAELVGSQMHCAVRTPPDLFLDDILVDAVVCASILLVDDGYRVQGFLPM